MNYKFISADGYEVQPGQKVFVFHNGKVESKTVGKIINQYRLLYDTPDSSGYEGARYSVVYVDAAKIPTVKVPNNA